MTAVRVINEAIERIETLEQENLLLRQLLWVWHGCGPIRFGSADPGELQCSPPSPDMHPPIDFGRDSAQEIEKALQQPSLDFIHQHQDDRCRHCGVTRWTMDANAPCTGVTHEWVTMPETQGGN